VSRAKLRVCGGLGAYTWSVTGSLPTGLTLNTTTGAITGTPQDAGTSSFPLNVAQASDPSNSATIPTSITIKA
jgi:Putative Ig domain